jgi:hypothetical protein
MKFGRTKEACGGDSVASGCEFFKRAISKHSLKYSRIIATLLARSRHRKRQLVGVVPMALWVF